MSNDLGISQLAENQSSPEVTVNTATAQLGDAISDQYAVDLTNNVSLTDAQWRRAMYFPVSNAPVATKSLTLAAKRKAGIIENLGANTMNVKVGTTTTTLAAGEVAIFYADGTANGLRKFALTPVSNPFDVALYVGAVMDNNERLLSFIAVRAFTLPASLTGSQFKAGTAATGSTTVTLKKNGSSIGTLVWAASGTVPTVTFASQVSFAAGDEFQVDGPATADASLAKIALNFMGTRP